MGADSGGLAAGFDLGIETGGTAPLGYKTKWGNNLKLAKLGLVESKSDRYPPRTFDNAKDSDATIRFAYDFFTAGEILTLKAIKQYDKPFFDIDLYALEEKNILIFDILDWFKENNIQVLNVAGNAGETKEISSKIFSLVRRNLKFWIQKYNEGY